MRRSPSPSEEMEKSTRLTEGSQVRILELEDEVRRGEAQRRRMHNLVQELRGNVRVLCRVRPPGPGQSGAGDLRASAGQDAVAVEVDPNAGEVRVQRGRASRFGSASYCFPSVFPFEVTQEGVFQEVEPVIQSVIDGYHACIFACKPPPCSEACSHFCIS